jgi:rubrerythrin
MENALKALAYAIEMEKEGERFYRSNIDRVQSTKVKRIFQNLAEMEKEHHAILLSQYEAISSGKPWLDLEAASADQANMFNNREKEESIPQSELESPLGDIPVLRMAYLLENDLAEYYRKLSESTEYPKGKAMLKTLSEWEIEHRNMLQAEYKELMERNWFEMGYAPFYTRYQQS